MDTTEKLQQVMRAVFMNASLVIAPHMTALDVDGLASERSSYITAQTIFLAGVN